MFQKVRRYGAIWNSVAVGVIKGGVDGVAGMISVTIFVLVLFLEDNIDIGQGWWIGRQMVSTSFSCGVFHNSLHNINGNTRNQDLNEFFVTGLRHVSQKGKTNNNNNAISTLRLKYMWVEVIILKHTQLVQSRNAQSNQRTKSEIETVVSFLMLIFFSSM